MEPVEVMVSPVVSLVALVVEQEDGTDRFRILMFSLGDHGTRDLIGRTLHRSDGYHNAPADG